MLGSYGPAKAGPGEQRYSPYDLPDGHSARPGHQALPGLGQQLLNPQDWGQQVCQFYQKAGWCRWGDGCRYIHAGGPERQVCQFFQKAGWCRWGDACRHIHAGSAVGVAAPAATTAAGQQPVCQFFQKAGWCKFGDGCRYIHAGAGPGPLGAGPGPGPQSPQGPPGPQGLGQEVCQFFRRTGWCKYGDGCRYLHTPGQACAGVAAPQGPVQAPGAGGSPLSEALAEFSKALSMVSQQQAPAG